MSLTVSVHENAHQSASFSNEIPIFPGFHNNNDDDSSSVCNNSVQTLTTILVDDPVQLWFSEAIAAIQFSDYEGVTGDKCPLCLPLPSPGMNKLP